MSSELAINAYVLLGNALNYLLRGGLLRDTPPELVEELKAEAGALEELDRRIRPLSPPQILTGIAGFTEGERELLGRCVRLCLTTLPKEEVGAVLGLPEDVATETLGALEAGFET